MGIIALIQLERVPSGRVHPELKELVRGNVHHTKCNLFILVCIYSIVFCQARGVRYQTVGMCVLIRF